MPDPKKLEKSSKKVPDPIIEFYNTHHDYRNDVVSIIVAFMRTRKMKGDNRPWSLEDLLDETEQLYVSPATKDYLIQEGLPNHPKITLLDEIQKYVYKPAFNKDGIHLIDLLKKHYDEDLGGVMEDDLVESYPTYRYHLKKHWNNIKVVPSCEGCKYYYVPYPQ